MSYYSLNESEFTDLESAILEQQLIEAVHRKICTFTPKPMHFISSYQKAILPSSGEIEVWSEAPVAVDSQTNILFQETEDKAYRLSVVLRIPQARVEASRNLGQSIDTIAVRQITRYLDKQLEAFTFKGPELTSTASGRTHDTAITGLASAAKAGNESTYDTVKFGTATGPYNTINDMRGKLLEDGFGYGKLDVIADTTLFPYFSQQQGAGLPTEYSMIKAELLNGGDIYPSDQLPPAESDDGFLLLVENRQTNYEIKTPRGLGLKNSFVWDPKSDDLVGRIEGFYTLSVYEPNAICWHSNVDITA